MENGTVILLLNLALIITFLVLIIAMSIRWVFFGLSIMFLKFKHKGNIGLLFLRSKANNFTIPLIVNLADKEHKVKRGKSKGIYPINREDFGHQGLFFGLPYAMFNDEDCKTSLGIMYHKSDDKGVPLYHDLEKTEPVYTDVKNSVTLSGTFLQALVDEKVFSDALKAFMDKNQMLLYLCAGAIIAAGVGAYFGYEMFANLLPNLDLTIQAGFEGIHNKLDLILEALK